jgi:hypothetical protein
LDQNNLRKKGMNLNRVQVNEALDIKGGILPNYVYVQVMLSVEILQRSCCASLLARKDTRFCDTSYLFLD